MVFSGEKREPSDQEMERLNPLHNFDLPCLKWGNQRVLRCMKVDSNGEASAGGRNHSPDMGRTRRFKSSEDRTVESFYKFSSSEKMKAIAGEGEIEATREKLMFDFQTEVGKMKDAILKRSFVGPSPAPATETVSGSQAVRTWNLRTRRASCKASFYSNGDTGNYEDRKPNVSSVRNECKKSVGGGGSGVAGDTSGEKRERSDFSVSLCRREVEEDFTAMTGRRLPRKPKKRPRVIQKQLDTLFPGLWLTEITADLYRVPDDPEPVKK